MKKSRFFILSAMFLASLSVCFGQKLSYEGYELKFEDNFDQKHLDKSNWSFEIHEPGWVNNELQEYIASDKAAYVKNGNLVIQASKNGSKYTSGRINTLGKHGFKYGIVEARIKVPKGKGFLPAFWMMPVNENLYGQWPKCGEIDIMEVLGDAIDTNYGTLHYGEPHTQTQFSAKSKAKSNYADEFHTFAVEWLPGKINFFVDGEQYGSADDWFTKKGSEDPITFPAPYDQEFYIILNVAVGGDWPGNPDKNTKFDKDAQMLVDYVRVYQKSAYTENVTKTEKAETFRPAESDGNYFRNGDFSKSEKLDDSTGWIFMTQGGGNGSAKIQNNQVVISTKSAGTQEYSIQLVQADVPVESGYKYRLSFDAFAEKPRTMKVGLTAPDRGWIRYFGDTAVNLTEKKQKFTYEFVMSEKSDKNARIDFNMGATNSTAQITLANIRLEKLGKAENTGRMRSALSDGNYVYNGTFDRGNDRMKYWEVEKGAKSKATVTNEKNIRQLKVDVSDNLTLVQSGIALAPDSNYRFAFDCPSGNGDKVSVNVAGIEVPLKKQGNQYTGKFSTRKLPGAATLKMTFAQKGTYIIDNVVIGEDALVQNGKFSAGSAGWELYTYNPGNELGIDSLGSDKAGRKNDNAAAVSISDTTTDDWKIQLKQNNVYLQKGKKYRLSFDVKSDIKREIKYALQRDGALWQAKHGKEDWTPYNDAPTVEINENYQTVVCDFEMTYPDDPNTILTFSMGAVNGKRINKPHQVCIDNVVLEVIE